MGTPTLFKFEVSAQDSEAVVQTFKTLAGRPDVDPHRIGIIGFSAGSTLACFAATDPRIRDQLAFITLFGGYFDATSLLRELGRRALIVDGHTQPWQPTYVPLQVFANAFSPTLTHNENLLFQHAFAPKGQPLSSYQQDQLSPNATAVYHLLEGDEPDMVDQNMAALSPQQRALLIQLSPSSVIDRIRTHIYLLHDRNDQYLPFSQSRQFAAALARIHHPYDFAEFGIFQHVEVRAGLGLNQELGDASQLFRILNAMLMSAS
jgi:acetyl esterase/lipase